MGGGNKEKDGRRRERIGKERQNQTQHPQHLIGGHEMTSTEVIFSARAGKSLLLRHMTTTGLYRTQSTEEISLLDFDTQ